MDLESTSEGVHGLQDAVQISDEKMMAFSGWTRPSLHLPEDYGLRAIRRRCSYSAEYAIVQWSNPKKKASSGSRTLEPHGSHKAASYFKVRTRNRERFKKEDVHGRESGFLDGLSRSVSDPLREDWFRFHGLAPFISRDELQKPWTMW